MTVCYCRCYASDWLENFMQVLHCCLSESETDGFWQTADQECSGQQKPGPSPKKKTAINNRQPMYFFFETRAGSKQERMGNFLVFWTRLTGVQKTTWNYFPMKKFWKWRLSGKNTLVISFLRVQKLNVLTGISVGSFYEVFFRYSSVLTSTTDMGLRLTANS